MGFAFAPSIVVLHHYFEKRFTVAIGIAIAGYSFGDLIFPLILQPMINTYGWKGTLFIMSAVELNLVVCGCIMVPPKKRNLKTLVKSKEQSVCVKCETLTTHSANESNVVECLQLSQDLKYTCNGIVNDSFDNVEATVPKFSNDHEETSRQSRTNLDNSDIIERLQKRNVDENIRQTHNVNKNCILSEYGRYRLLRPLFSPFFLVMLAVMFLHGIGWYAVIENLVPFAINYNVPDLQAAELLTFIGVGSLVGCLTQGWFIDKQIVSSEVAKTTSLTCLTLISFAFPFAYNPYEVLVTLCVFYGLAAGISLTLFFALVRHLLPPQDVSAGISLVILAEMLEDTIGGVLAGRCLFELIEH